MPGMKDYDPRTMIPVKDAKAHAMGRRFDVPPEKRVRVNLYCCEAEDSHPYAFKEEKDLSWTVLLESFPVWVKDEINMVGDKGAYGYVFDRREFYRLFADYPKYEMDPASAFSNTHEHGKYDVSLSQENEK